MTQEALGFVLLDLWYVTLFLRNMDKCLVTPDREPITDQLKDATKVQLDEPMGFMGVT